MVDPFNIHPSQGPEIPIIVSVPHCGTEFPKEIAGEYRSDLAKSPDDTDWFVNKLYDFVSQLGITMIAARYSRWVIDLNRDPNSKPLYSDGRIITALCPTTTFGGESIYKDERKDILPQEIKRRLEQYYQPYHRKLSELLEIRKQKFGKVLLWDCHSIRQFVPAIHKEKFPDLILGDADGTSASPGLSETALSTLEKSSYSVSHNFPFKGGYITRVFGKPGNNQHALQLEMSKVNYMDDREQEYHAERAENVRNLLMKVFEKLIDQMK